MAVLSVIILVTQGPGTFVCGIWSQSSCILYSLLMKFSSGKGSSCLYFNVMTFSTTLESEFPIVWRIIVGDRVLSGVARLRFCPNFVSILLKSNQICPNLINFNVKIFARWCGCIPSSYITGLMKSRSWSLVWSQRYTNSKYKC